MRFVKLATVCASLSILTLAGCAAGPVAMSDAAAVSDGELTMIVTSPRPGQNFDAGDSVPFEIEVYAGDRLGQTSHPGHGGHYHVVLEGVESITYASESPSFQVLLPGDLATGTHQFRVEYHDSDGETGRFFVRIPFRVASTSLQQ